jgi:hypothetical protein
MIRSESFEKTFLESSHLVGTPATVAGRKLKGAPATSQEIRCHAATSINVAYGGKHERGAPARWNTLWFVRYGRSDSLATRCGRVLKRPMAYYEY